MTCSPRSIRRRATWKPMNPAAPVTSVSDFPPVMLVPRLACRVPSTSATRFHEGQLTIDSPIQVQWRQGLPSTADLNVSVSPVTEYIQCMPVMIRTAMGLEQRLERLRRLPMSGEQSRSGGVAPAEHEREMVRIPLSTPRGIGDEQTGSGCAAKLSKIAVSQIAVLPD